MKGDSKFWIYDGGFKFWLSQQDDYDIEEATMSIREELSAIKAAQ